MKKLATSLEMLHKAVKEEIWDLYEARLRKNVTGQFSKIAEIVNYDGCPCYRSEDDNDEEDDKGDEGDDTEGKMEVDIQ